MLPLFSNCFRIEWLQKFQLDYKLLQRLHGFGGVALDPREVQDGIVARVRHIDVGDLLGPALVLADYGVAQPLEVLVPPATDF